MTGEELKMLRERLEWTQSDMAAYLHIKRGQVARLEGGSQNIRGAVEARLMDLAKIHPS